MNDYPHILEQSPNTIIIALSDTEVGKVMLPNPMVFVDHYTGEEVDWMRSPSPEEIFETELKGLRHANKINPLMPQFFRVQPWQTDGGTERPMLVMERVHRLPYRDIDLPTRRAMLLEFEAQMKELHDSQFVHGDLMRPTHFFNRNDYDWMFSNIVQTREGLRLIDAGFSTICAVDNVKLFVHTLFREREEVAIFKQYYLKEEV